MVGHRLCLGSLSSTSLLQPPQHRPSGHIRLARRSLRTDILHALQRRLSAPAAALLTRH
jgi:hypothetical protein